MAGRSSFDASAARVGSWFSPDRILWGYDDDLWSQYEVFGQPVAFLISGDNTVLATWFGAADEGDLRNALDAVIAAG